MIFKPLQLKKYYTDLINFYHDQIDFCKKIKARLKGRKIVISKYARINNFGDKFNVDLVHYFGAELIYTGFYEKSQIVLTGSILGDYHRNFSGYIAGAGFISNKYNRLGNRWKVKIIRGPLSAEQCGVEMDVVYADPGILASQIYLQKKIEKYKLGIIPHKRDLDFISKQKWGDCVKIISPRQSPSKVAKDMNECRYIASSSLHGLIFADSFRIPNVHLKISDKLAGGTHKFSDYYLGMEVEPELLYFSDSLSVEDIIRKCKLRYSKEYLSARQQEISPILEKLINQNR